MYSVGTVSDTAVRYTGKLLRKYVLRVSRYILGENVFLSSFLSFLFIASIQEDGC